jgi:hypothetical protein
MSVNNSLTGMFPIENSSYYSFHLLEKDQVMKHKWVLSERNNSEVTFSYAQWDWIVHHREAWLQALRASGVL